MRTKVYLANPQNHRVIDSIAGNEHINWSGFMEDEKGLYYLFEGMLDKEKLASYPGVREIEHIE